MAVSEFFVTTDLIHTCLLRILKLSVLFGTVAFFSETYFDRKGLQRANSQNLGMRFKIGNVGMGST